jgi:hypothetical protein
MRKATSFSIVLLIFTLATVAVAGTVVPGPNALNGTTWVGVLTFVRASGITETDNATLTFTAESGNFLAGTLECKEFSTCGLLPAAPGIEFSCIRNGNELHLTATGYSLFGLLTTGPVPKKGNPPHKKMMIQGGDIELGNMFQGILIKQ